MYLQQLYNFYYIKKIPIKVAIDQLNVVTSLMKEWNNFYEPYIK